MELPIFNPDSQGGKKKIFLKPEVFEADINENAVYQVVRAYLSSVKKKTAKVKTRSEVSGGGKKPWRQKGTGRARAGTIRSPLWKGGGVAFGPSPRESSIKVTKKIKQKALLSALSYKAKENQIIILDDLRMEKPQTKKAKEILDKLNLKESITLVFGEGEEVVGKSFRNLPKIEIVNAKEINPYFVLNNEKLILTKKSVEYINQVWGKC